jgi:hypothetical protein
MEDPAKKRREYLVRINQAGIGAVLFGILTLVLTLIAFVMILYALVLPYDLEGDDPGPTPVQHVAITWSTIAVVIAFGCCSAVVCARNCKRIEATIYVPPVLEQVAALPAEAVLMRGSEEPTAAPEELLRAAREGAESEAAELLRAEPGSAGRQRPA